MEHRINGVDDDMKLDEEIASDAITNVNQNTTLESQMNLGKLGHPVDETVRRQVNNANVSNKRIFYN